MQNFTQIVASFVLRGTGLMFLTLFMFFVCMSAVFAQDTDRRAADTLEQSGFVAKTIPDSANDRVVRPPSESRKSKTTPSDWNGFYAGGYVGASLARATANTSTVLDPTGYFFPQSVSQIETAGRQKLDQDRFTGGGTFGYNHQSGNWVVGAETDFGVQRKTTAATATVAYLCCFGSFTLTQTMKTSWLWTARPRVGYTLGKALFYVTGGVAVSRLNYQGVFTDNNSSAHENGGLIKTKAGFTGGGGIEYKIHGHWSAKGEYLYSDFGRSTTTSTNLTATLGVGAFPQNVFTHSIFNIQHDLRFGINYHF